MTTEPREVVAARQRALRERRKAEGLVLVRVWVRKEDAKRVRAFVDKISGK